MFITYGFHYICNMHIFLRYSYTQAVDAQFLAVYLLGNVPYCLIRPRWQPDGSM